MSLECHLNDIEVETQRNRNSQYKNEYGSSENREVKNLEEKFLRIITFISYL